MRASASDERTAILVHTVCVSYSLPVDRVKSQHHTRALRQPSLLMAIPVLRTLLFYCSFWLLLGCNQNGEPVAQASSPSASELQLASKVEELTKQAGDLSRRLRRLEIRYSLEQEANSYGVFNGTDEGFQRIDANFGTFAVSVKDLQSYGNGSRIKVNLGNLSSATFKGVKLKLKYGEPEPSIETDNFFELHQAWEASLKQKENDVLQDVLPGSWNPVQVTLPGVEPKRFGYLEVRIETNVITLR